MSSISSSASMGAAAPAWVLPSLSVMPPRMCRRGSCSRETSGTLPDAADLAAAASSQINKLPAMFSSKAYEAQPDAPGEDWVFRVPPGPISCLLEQINYFFMPEKNGRGPDKWTFLLSPPPQRHRIFSCRNPLNLFSRAWDRTLIAALWRRTARVNTREAAGKQVWND